MRRPCLLFSSNASNVLIRNIIVEKYSNSAQTGAINGRSAASWSIENVEARWTAELEYQWGQVATYAGATFTTTVE